MATRSSRQAGPRSISGKPRRRARVPREDAAGQDLEEIAARAARLGISAERVLQEYARIAFADLRHIVKWGAGGLEVMTPETLSDADAAAIAEIIGASGSGPTRVKLFDKKAALDAIARHLGMFPCCIRRARFRATPAARPVTPARAGSPPEC